MSRAALVALVWMALAAFVPEASAASSVKAPESLAGVRLGTNIKDCLDMCDISRSYPSRDNPGLLEADAFPPPGFRKGDITYGACANAGVVVRVDFKLEDGSREFFDRLLKEYRRVFGKPDEYRGDPFHAVITWKWSFRNDKNESISLMLTNSRDDDYKLGTFIKLTNRTLWDIEAECWRKKNPPLAPRPAKSEKGADGAGSDPDDLSRFLPK